MINSKKLIDDIKSVRICFTDSRGAGKTFAIQIIEKYNVHIINLIEKQPKVKTEENPPLSFKDFEYLKWVWDNQRKEYIRIEEYDGWHDCYWVSTIEELNDFRVYKEDCKENRFYRWEVI